MDQFAELDAGDAGVWLDEIGRALGDGTDTDVPCGSCTACCRSSQFVQVGADEADSLAHIPVSMLFPAPGRGGFVLGYDERGRCPMLAEHGCSVYSHRPRTCRTYDCRVFAAAGIEPDQPAVAERVRRWRFSTASDGDQARLDAVRAAARYLLDHPAVLGAGAPPTAVALAAVELRDLFAGGAEPTESDVRHALARLR